MWVAFFFLLSTFSFDLLEKGNVEPYINKTVSLRGFIHQSEEEETFLAKLPSIRSCCLSKFEKVRLVGSIPSVHPGRAVTIEGIFIVSPSGEKIIKIQE